LDAGAIASGLARHTEAFCRHWFPEGRKVGNYWQMADVSGAKGRSLTIRLRSQGGRNAGKWTDYQSGDHGDLLDLLQHRLEPVSYPDLLREAANFLGETPTLSDRHRVSIEPNLSGSRQIAAGRRLFSYGQPIQSTLAETYLRGRGITRIGPALRFHPNAYLRDEDGRRLAFPALLAAITDNAGEITGCSRIFLDSQTGKLAPVEAPKRVLGRLHGHAIRIGNWQSCTDLIAGEGLENTLSVGTVLPQAALVSCLTANHLAAFLYSASIDRLWIARDRDKAGARAARHLSARARRHGIRPIVLTPERGDFNLDLVEGGADAMRQRLTRLIEAETSEHDLWSP
jgi:hypothetical protein